MIQKPVYHCVDVPIQCPVVKCSTVSSAAAALNGSSRFIITPSPASSIVNHGKRSDFVLLNSSKICPEEIVNNREILPRNRQSLSGKNCRKGCEEQQLVTLPPPSPSSSSIIFVVNLLTNFSVTDDGLSRPPPSTISEQSNYCAAANRDDDDDDDGADDVATNLIAEKKKKNEIEIETHSSPSHIITRFDDDGHSSTSLILSPRDCVRSTSAIIEDNQHIEPDAIVNDDDHHHASAEHCHAAAAPAKSHESQASQSQMTRKHKKKATGAGKKLKIAPGHNLNLPDLTDAEFWVKPAVAAAAAIETHPHPPPTPSIKNVLPKSSPKPKDIDHSHPNPPAPVQVDLVGSTQAANRGDDKTTTADDDVALPPQLPQSPLTVPKSQVLQTNDIKKEATAATPHVSPPVLETKKDELKQKKADVSVDESRKDNVEQSRPVAAIQGDIVESLPIPLVVHQRYKSFEPKGHNHSPSVFIPRPPNYQQPQPQPPPHRRFYPHVINFMTIGAPAHYPGPDEAQLMAILNQTGYTLELTNGQRKYGPPQGLDGKLLLSSATAPPPPPSLEPPMQSAVQNSGSSQQPQPLPPSSNCEIFVGRIPKEIFEDELIPLFETVGRIYDLRLMMDPVTGYSRGYAFMTYFTKEDALSAVARFDNYEIRPRKHIRVKISVPNVRLFIGNIPKEMGKDEIYKEFYKHAPGLSDVIVYNLPNDRRRNRGFCFLEYESHKMASHAKRKLISSRVKVWGAEILVDWAEPLEEPDEATMAKVKVLYVRNLHMGTSEEGIKALFEQYGPVERVKRIKDYAFVHFERREYALAAMAALQGKELTPGSGLAAEISLAKPPSDKKRKEEILRSRERRMMNLMQSKPMFMYHSFPPPGAIQQGCPRCPMFQYQTPIQCAAVQTAASGTLVVAQSPVVMAASSSDLSTAAPTAMLPIQPAGSSQIVAATLQSAGSSDSAYHYHAHIPVPAGPFQSVVSAPPQSVQPSSTTAPAPSAVARVTLGAAPPAPTVVQPQPSSSFVLPMHPNAHQHHHHHHHHHGGGACQYSHRAAHHQSSSLLGAMPPPSSTATSDYATQGTSCTSSLVSTASSTSVGGGGGKLGSLYTPVQSYQTWYNWYQPDWWYASTGTSAASTANNTGGVAYQLMAAAAAPAAPSNHSQPQGWTSTDGTTYFDVPQQHQPIYAQPTGQYRQYRVQFQPPKPADVGVITVKAPTSTTKESTGKAPLLPSYKPQVSSSKKQPQSSTMTTSTATSIVPLISISSIKSNPTITTSAPLIPNGILKKSSSSSVKSPDSAAAPTPKVTGILNPSTSSTSRMPSVAKAN